MLMIVTTVLPNITGFIWAITTHAIVLCKRLKSTIVKSMVAIIVVDRVTHRSVFVENA